MHKLPPCLLLQVYSKACQKAHWLAGYGLVFVQFAVQISLVFPSTDNGIAAPGVTSGPLYFSLVSRIFIRSHHQAGVDKL
jgi:hypothetical protein